MATMDLQEGLSLAGCRTWYSVRASRWSTYAVSRWTIEIRGLASNEASRCEH
jgi:hypothetical protein